MIENTFLVITFDPEVQMTSCFHSWASSDVISRHFPRIDLGDPRPPLPPPENVQNSNTVQRQSEYPSFAFGTDGARSPCVLASPLGLMAHKVCVS